MTSKSHLLDEVYKNMLHKKTYFQIMIFIPYTCDTQISFVNYFNSSNNPSSTYFFAWSNDPEWKDTVNSTLYFNQSSSTLRVTSL